MSGVFKGVEMEFKDLVDSGLSINITVEDAIFSLVRVDFPEQKYYILSKTEDEEAWDVLGEETDYEEAKLCFITEVSIYRDLSYEEV